MMRSSGISTILKGITIGIAGAGLVTFAASSAMADIGHGQKSANNAESNMMGGLPGSESHIDRTIVVGSKDLKYSIGSLKVRDGETVRFIVKNTSDVEHDFTIGTPEVQRAHRGKMEKMMDMMAEGKNSMGHDHANAVFVKPGETQELIWTFKRTANLEFGCNVPGHYEAGMKGEITFVN